MIFLKKWGDALYDLFDHDEFWEFWLAIFAGLSAFGIIPCIVLSIFGIIPFYIPLICLGFIDIFLMYAITY